LGFQNRDVEISVDIGELGNWSPEYYISTRRRDLTDTFYPLTYDLKNSQCTWHHECWSHMNFTENSSIWMPTVQKSIWLCSSECFLYLFDLECCGWEGPCSVWYAMESTASRDLPNLVFIHWRANSMTLISQ
jgi:hypothetical protein